MEGLINKYKLSNEEHNKIYTLIENMVFNNAHPVEEPTAIIVGAQPGSGKGSLIGYSKSQFMDNNVVIITTDDYKPFHPKAEEIAQKYPTKYAAIVEADSASWTNDILMNAINKKYNFIFEITLRNERIVRKMHLLKKNGYRIIVRGLAVPYLESLVSSFERYEKQVETRNWGRFINPEKYNRTYEQIPNTVETIEKSGYCDALEVYIRGKNIKLPELIYGKYSSEYKNKNNIEDFNKKYTTAKQAIIAGRNNKVDMIEIQKRIRIIENSFNNRETTQEEKQRMKELKNIINNY